jgi:hypothetical protein
MKSWLQTAPVHCHHPRRLVADLGGRRAFAVLAMFTGGFASPLLGPAYGGAAALQRRRSRRC